VPPPAKGRIFQRPNHVHQLETHHHVELVSGGFIHSNPPNTAKKKKEECPLQKLQK
jgi:hypothetical protein